jgi:signal peptidase II
MDGLPVTLLTSSSWFRPVTTAILLASAVATVALDQLSKALVTSRLQEGQRVVLAGGSGLRRVTNVRAGMLPLSDRGAFLLWLAIVACLGVVVALGLPLRSADDIGLGLILGGATSNLLDRLTRGGVVDFIAVGRWPTFNLADAAMVAGTALAAWSLL